MDPPHARSRRRLAFTAISFLLPVCSPLPPRFATLTTTSPSPSLTTRCCTSSIQHQNTLLLALQQQCPRDNFIAAAAILTVAPRTRSRCPGNVHPLLAGAAAEPQALEEERAGGQEELGGGTFYAVPSSSGLKLDGNEEYGREDATHTADRSPTEEDSRRDTTVPASLTGRERWQRRVRQAGVTQVFGRVFRARSLRRGLALVVSRAAPSSTTTAAGETFHNNEITNLEKEGVDSGGLSSRWRRWRRRLPRRSGHPSTKPSRAATVTAAAAAAAAAAATAAAVAAEADAVAAAKGVAPAAVAEAAVVVAEAEAEAETAEAVAERELPVPRGKEMGPAGERGVEMGLAREGGVEGEGGAREAACTRGVAEIGGVVGNAREGDVSAVAAATVDAAAAAVDSTNGGDTDDTVGGGGSASVERAARPTTYDGEEVSPEAWAKVDEIRRRAIHKSCDPETREAESLRLWLASGGKGREGLTDTDILRFVMFRQGDVDAAWKQLKLAAAWRQEYRVDDILSEERWPEFKELQEEIFWIGRDSGGRPTMMLRSIAHLPGRIDSDEFQRYFLFLLEQGRQLWGVGSVRQMNIVVDRVGAGLKNQDPRLLSTMLPVFRDAYPDIVHRCYVAPSSWIFRFVWIIAARLVDDRQRKRVLMLLGEWKLRLLEDFDASTLPLHLGGTMDQYPPLQPPVM